MSVDRYVPNLAAAIENAKRSGNVAELVESYRNYLLLLAETWVDTSMQGKFDRSDLVQETILKAHERFGQFQGHTEAELIAWLRQILARQLIDMNRRYRGATRDVAREVAIERSLDASSLALVRILPTCGTSPSEHAHRRELAVLLANALATMKPEYRDVILMRNLQELTWREISQRMERSEGSVRMLWTRALIELRPMIEKQL